MDINYLINKTFANLGLTKREQEVFNALAKQGSSTLRELIVTTKLKKPTVYRVITDLETRGLVYSASERGARVYTAQEPKRILGILESERRKLKRLELEFKEALPQLNSVFQGRREKPKVEMFQNQEGYETLVTQSLECKEKIIYYLGNFNNILQVVNEEYDQTYYIPKRLKNNTRFLLLTQSTPLTLRYQGLDQKKNRETRFLHKDQFTDASLLIFDNTVTFFSEAKEMLALAITSPSIARIAKMMFSVLWNQTSDAQSNVEKT